MGRLEEHLRFPLTPLLPLRCAPDAKFWRSTRFTASPSFLIVNGGSHAELEVRRPRRADSPVGKTGRCGSQPVLGGPADVSSLPDTEVVPILPKRVPVRYASCVCVCPLCVALAPACGPRCVAPRSDFLIGRALATLEE